MRRTCGSGKPASAATSWTKAVQSAHAWPRSRRSKQRRAPRLGPRGGACSGAPAPGRSWPDNGPSNVGCGLGICWEAACTSCHQQSGQKAPGSCGRGRYSRLQPRFQAHPPRWCKVMQQPLHKSPCKDRHQRHGKASAKAIGGNLQPPQVSQNPSRGWPKWQEHGGNVNCIRTPSQVLQPTPHSKASPFSTGRPWGCSRRNGSAGNLPGTSSLGAQSGELLATAVRVW